jgi:hypothetical protein
MQNISLCSNHVAPVLNGKSSDENDTNIFLTLRGGLYCSWSIILVTIDQYNRFYCPICSIFIVLIVIHEFVSKSPMAQDGGNGNWLDMDDMSFKFDTPAPLSARKC